MAMLEVLGLHRVSTVSLISYINQANGSDINPEHMIFGTPAPVEGTWYQDTTDRNTVIRITAGPASKYEDSIVVVYDRLNLGDLENLIPSFGIKTYLPETTHDLVAVIRRRFGILLSPEEIELQPLTDVLVDNSDSTTPVYRITTVPGAIGWYGQLDVPVTEGDALLSDYLLETTLPGLNYPVEGDGENGSAIMYFYGIDFTPWKEVLETYPEELVLDEFSDEFLTMVKEADRQQGKALWNLDPDATEWSLHGAEIVYNGLNDAMLPTKPMYKYVLGIAFRGDMTTPPGTAYFHYNDPVDPNEV